MTRDSKSILLRTRAGVAVTTLAAAILVLLLCSASSSAATGFELVVSSAPDRSAPAALDGRGVSGPIYVFVAPDAGASQVRFWLDNPTASGTPRKTEKNAPWDFAGSAPDGSALPFDTTSLADGVHTITAAVTLSTGGSEVVTSSFTVGNDAPALTASPTSLSFAVDVGGTGSSQTVDVAMTDGSSVFVSAGDDAPWLSVTPSTGATPAALTVAVDASGLAAGAYSGTVTVTGPALDAVTIPVTLQVRSEPGPDPEGFRLLTSGSPSRAAPVPLEGRTVEGPIHVFLAPETGVRRVRFYLDDPGMTRTPRKIESGAPYDFAGSASNGSALPFDSATIPDGLHSITAAVELSVGGTEVTTSSFRVANTGPALEASPATVSFAVEPGGTTSPHPVNVAMSDGSAVGFSVSDNASWLSVTPATGTTPRELSLSVDAAGLPAGTYTATVTATSGGMGAVTIPVTLQVVASLEPDQIHLSWTEEPSTTLTVVWRTWQTSTPHVVEYRVAGTSTWSAATGSARPSGTAGTLHETTLEGLTPATAYEYRVRGDGSAWSDVFTTRTAPPPGPADFDAVYVADTGLVGRADGLATGTQQVIDEIAELNPDLVLLGGDYAYYNTDQRYGTLDNSIDAWFNQMQPIGARSPMMVSYGNHETLLSERFEDWAPRFATPQGWDGRRAYSFDVGDVHFTAIFAVSDTAGLSSGQLQWIEQDIVAAKAAGARWVVPFLLLSLPPGLTLTHVTPSAAV